jgi:hypothetical protein
MVPGLLYEGSKRIPLTQKLCWDSTLESGFFYLAYLYARRTTRCSLFNLSESSPYSTQLRDDR